MLYETSAGYERNGNDLTCASLIYYAWVRPLKIVHKLVISSGPVPRSASINKETRLVSLELSFLWKPYITGNAITPREF